MPLVAETNLKAKLEKEYADNWWSVDERGGKKIAQAIRRSAERREVALIPQRWRNLVFYREMTGRPTPTTYLYGMGKRPSNFAAHYGRFQFSGMKSRFAGTMADVFRNRLLAHQTFISLIPWKGDWAARNQGDNLEGWTEGAFDDLDYWQERSTAIIESFFYGTGCLKFDEDGQGGMRIRAKNIDELLPADPDDPRPYDMIDRVWAKKTELLEQYKDNPEACAAILKAPTAQPAFYFGGGTLDCTDTVALIEATTHPIGKKPGRHVLCVGDYTFFDKDWDRPLQYEMWQFEELPGSLFGQGIAEILLQISQWIDGLLTSTYESQIRNGKGKWLAEENSNVNPDTLGNVDAAVVWYLKSKPEFVTPDPIGQYTINWVQILQEIGRGMVHVSEAAVKGEMPAGITAAVAMEKYSQIDDQNFLEKIARLEDLDKRAAYQLIILGKHTKPSFGSRSERRKIDWDEIKLTSNFKLRDLQAFNVGRISQTVAGRLQILKEMHTEGTLPSKLYVKYSQIPDIAGMFSDINSTADDVQMQLDRLVKSDAYIPPSPYCDFEYAKQAGESRYDREEADGAPQAVLDRISIWLSALAELTAQNATPDSVTPSPFGFQAPQLPPVAGEPTPAAPPPTLPLLQNAAAPGG